MSCEMAVDCREGTFVDWKLPLDDVALLLNMIENKTYKNCQSLYYPTNAHNVKNVELLKHIKII